MGTPINILIVEDSADDAALLVDELTSAGFDPKWKRVETKQDYRDNLGAHLDIVFSDFTLPQFSTPDALKLLQESNLDIPFIIVSGTIGEEHAVQSMKAGATDYVMKGNLARLAPAVVRELKEAEARRQKRRVELALRESEARFRQMAENIHEVFWLASVELTEMLYISPSFAAIWGRSCQCLYENPRVWLDAVHPDDLECVRAAFLNRRTMKDDLRVEYRIVRPDNSVRWISDNCFPVCDASDRIYRVAGVAVDITERKQAEEEIREFSSQLVRLQDEERRRIGRELHDSTAQELTAVATNLALVQQRIDGHDLVTENLLADSQAIIEQCHREVRTISYLLHPPLLDELGLADAIGEYSDGFTKRSSIATRVEISPTLGRLAVETEEALFRVVQESLSNVHRHSGSPTVSIRIVRKSAVVVLEVIDEGHGLPSEMSIRRDGTVSKMGVGVASMRERIRRLGGRLEIESSGRGTTVRAIIASEMRTNETGENPDCR